MARTVGYKWPSDAPRGDRQANCSYCGARWRLSELKRDASGNWACPDDQAGRDRVTLDRLNANSARRLGRPRPRGDNAPYFGNQDFDVLGTENGAILAAEDGSALGL